MRYLPLHLKQKSRWVSCLCEQEEPKERFNIDRHIRSISSVTTIPFVSAYLKFLHVFLLLFDFPREE